jgi:hypothetical protein
MKVLFISYETIIIVIILKDFGLKPGMKLIL